MSKLKIILVGLVIVLIMIFLIGGYFSISKNQQLESRLADVRSQISQKDYKISELDQIIQNLKDVEGEYLDDINKLKLRIDELEILNKQVSISKGSLNSKLETITLAFQQQQEQLVQEKAVLKDTLKSQLASRDSQITKLTQKVHSQGQVLSELIGDKEALESTLRAKITDRNDQVLKLQNQLAAMEQRLEEFTASKQQMENELRGEIGTREIQISGLQERLNEKESELSSNQKLYAEAIEKIRLLETDHNNKNIRIKYLGNVVKNLTQERNTETQLFTQTISEYKESLVDRDRELTIAGEQIEAMKKEEQNLIQNLKAVEIAIKEFERVQTQTDKKVNELENKIQRRDKKLSAANAYLNKLMASEKELEEQIMQTRSVMQAEKVKKSEAWERVLELQANMRERGQNLKQLSARLSETEKEKREAEQSMKRMKETYDDLIDQFQTEITSKEAVIKKLTEKLSVTFFQDILFKLGSTTISYNGKQKLKKIGKILKQNTTDRIVIMGHSDSLPIAPENRERFPSNWELSAARAATVIRYFQHTIGIDPRQMEAVGHSLYKPVLSNDTSENRAKNRRVEIFIIPAQ